MPDNSQGKIYIKYGNTSDRAYIGSTTLSLAKRISRHKFNFHRYLKGKYSYVKSFDILSSGKYDIELLEVRWTPELKSTKAYLGYHMETWIKDLEFRNIQSSCHHYHTTSQLHCKAQHNHLSKHFDHDTKGN
jgi:hypothetical protein